MRMSRLGGAPAKGIWISSFGSRANEKDGSRMPDIPCGENQQETGMKKNVRGWHNGLEA